MQVRYMNLSIDSKKKRKPFIKKFDELLQAGVFIMGEEVISFEKKIASFCSSKYCVGVGNGTDALILALLAFDIGYGDEVIIPDMSFVATANAVSILGAKPIFCDITDDFNLDTSKVELLITSKTKAIIPVHYGGKIISNINNLLKLGEKYNLKIIEDASQAFGSELKGKKAGTFGELGCISLNPMKTLGGFGEAGIILTDSKKLFTKIKALRYNGLNEQKTCIYKSFNAKMDTLQAAFLSIKVDNLDYICKKRAKIFSYYNKHLQEFAITPQINKHEKSSFYSYTILIDKKLRNKLFNYLVSNNIEVKINHLSMHQEPAYNKEKHMNLNNSKKLSKMKLALPFHENLTTKEVKFVVSKIKEFFKRESKNVSR